MAISSNATGLRPGVCTSTTRPSNPYLGQLIFETDTFVLNFWNGSSWQGAVSAPAGTVQPFAGTTAPTGWLLCGGQAISRTTYANLFAIIGTTYGAGDGSTTFNIPDLRGRTVAGLDNIGGTSANRITSGNSGIVGTTLGAAGGDERLQQHQHANTLTNNTVTSTGESVTHTHSGTTGTMNSNTSHSHLTFTQSVSAALTSGPNGTFVYNAGTGASSSTTNTDHTHNFSTGNASAAHSHNVTSNVTISNVNAGSGGSQNVQPTILLNYMIKF